MKKQVVCSIMIMSMALVTLGCEDVYDNSSKNPTQQVVEQEATVTSYNKEVELGVGEKLTLKKLNIVTDGDIDFNFKSKTYNKIGTYDEVIEYDGGELKVKVIVSDKTAPVISGTHDITVIEGEDINILDGVSTDEESELKVSDYDSSLLDTPQTVTITATDKAGNTSEVTVNLTIKSNPIESMDKTMYASSSVNVRAGSSADTERVGSLSLNEQVHVTGRDKNTGWYQIEYNGSVGYVSNSYLSDNKTEVKTSSSTPSQASAGGSSSSSSSSSAGDSSSSGQSDSSVGGFDENFGVMSLEEAQEESKQNAIDSGWWDEDGNHIDSETW